MIRGQQGYPKPALCSLAGPLTPQCCSAWGATLSSSSKLKKQTQPFFPVVFPVCLRNIIFPQNEKNNNNLQEGPKHEPIYVRFQSKQALNNKFLQYSSHV